MKKLFLILAVLTALFLAYATYLALKVAPTDALQGDVYRIIYYHVPSAWTAFLLFFINFIASSNTWRGPRLRCRKRFSGL